ncbi:galectin-3-binding protein A-like [Dendronephthya gigantea]|uniref:galectin-3-binding protein A-like n=1 Tax=Dendronephthya gigantea TaxID=151771 RepID=UPI00106A9E14|nr:galectin-3-binding protein A-like [Dendronephthya gigantea]
MGEWQRSRTIHCLTNIEIVREETISVQHGNQYYAYEALKLGRRNFSATPVSVRLQGPLNGTGTGRVEVFFRGYWGTICDNGWDMRDTRVICRQLGYPDSVRTLKRNEAPSGSGQIWFSYLSCSGEEQNITSCSYRWDYPYCSHYADVGVKCSTTGYKAH